MRPSRALPRRPITTDELTLARALWSPTVRYPAGSADQRWVRNTCGTLAMGAAGQTMITDLTGRRLIGMALRMRRQLPSDVLTLAERMAKRDGITTPRRGLSTTTAAALLVLAVSTVACSNCWAVPGCKAPPPAPAPKDTVTR